MIERDFTAQGRCHGCLWSVAVNSRGLCVHCDKVLCRIAHRLQMSPTELYDEIVSGVGVESLRVLDHSSKTIIRVGSAKPRRPVSARRAPREREEIIHAREVARDTLKTTTCEVDGWFYSFTPEIAGGNVVVNESRMRTGMGSGAA